MEAQNLQAFSELVCRFDQAMCARVGVPILRRAPAALSAKPPKAKVVASGTGISDTTKFKSTSRVLDTNVNSIDGVAKKKSPKPKAVPKKPPTKSITKVATKAATKATSKVASKPTPTKPALTKATPKPKTIKPTPTTKATAKLKSNPTKKPKAALVKKPTKTVKTPVPVKETNGNSNLKIMDQQGALRIPGALHSLLANPKRRPKRNPNVSKTNPPGALKDLTQDQPKLNLEIPKNITKEIPKGTPKEISPITKPISKPVTKPITKAPAKCLPNRRKEIRELTPAEVKAYIEAIKKLHAKDRDSQVSRYDKYAAIHVKMHRYIHGVPAFLPWHRQFIREYELELQEIDPTVTLPYWDWTIDSQFPHKSPVLSDSMFGGNGNPNEDMCITKGYFAHWMVTTPKPHCLRRDYREGKVIPALTSIDIMSGIINDVKEYEDFVFDLEVHHGPLHLDVGGERGDLNPMHSPNDPLFFLHHTFIDMLWYNWQMKHRRSKPYGGIAQGKSVSVTDKLEPFNVTVQDVLDTRSPSLCYFYNPYHPKVDSLLKRTGFSFDTLSNSNLTKSTSPPHAGALKSVDPLPEAWLRMNNLDVSRARKVESERELVTSNLNALGVAPASESK